MPLSNLCGWKSYTKWTTGIFQSKSWMMIIIIELDISENFSIIHQFFVIHQIMWNQSCLLRQPGETKTEIKTPWQMFCSLCFLNLLKIMNQWRIFFAWMWTSIVYWWTNVHKYKSLYKTILDLRRGKTGTRRYTLPPLLFRWRFYFIGLYFVIKLFSPWNQATHYKNQAQVGSDFEGDISNHSVGPAICSLWFI